MKIIQHLTLRVAWHDSKWNGQVCAEPSNNSFCAMLDRIRLEKNDKQEDLLRGKSWADLTPEQLPPCKAESGIFMNTMPWRRKFEHPYVNNKHCKETHGGMYPRILEIPPYTAIAVPFRWMLSREQSRIEEQVPEELPADVQPPFPSPWVFGKDRQCALSNHVFNKLEENKSLIFFYCKEGHPVGEGIRRLVVGVGTLTKIGKLTKYDSTQGPSYPLWDRPISHSIRPDGKDGFLLPYHDYLVPTGKPAEDERRKALLHEIVVEAEDSHYGDFSYAAEVTRADVALSTLVKCLKAVQNIRKHDIAQGPWQAREDWLNAQIAAAWQDRGRFPGVGSALEALGLRLGTALVLDMRARDLLSADKDPWPAIIDVLEGNQPPPQDAYRKDLATVKPVWAALPEERRTLLKLLSRFDLTPAQAKRFFDPKERTKSFIPCPSDAEIIENPYILAEGDLGTTIEIPVSMTTIDRGLLPDEIAGGNDPVPEPSCIESPNDPRRVRCALVGVLRKAAANGDSLLSLAECQNKLEKIDTLHPIQVTTDWLRGHGPFVSKRVGYAVLCPDGREENNVETLQLVELAKREKRLRKVLTARALRQEPSLNVDWNDLLITAIRKNGGEIDTSNERHLFALQEQAQALENITTRRLSVLIGQAGTGKTSIVGALVGCEPLIRMGILLLAPTGKARVRLAGATGIEAMTVAQFLYQHGRYDGVRQCPRFEGDNPKATKYASAQTVVIDEASMLTMEYLQAILDGLDLTSVSRIILVGDPNQLPPIGAGRPFVDLVAQLENAPQQAGKAAPSGAIGRLHVEVRTKAGEPSDALRLAAWYTNQPVNGESERVLSEVGHRLEFNDLEIAFWKTPDDLQNALLDQFQKHLGLNAPDDVDGFNAALGFVDNNVLFANPDGIENFQLLSPERAHPYGVHDLNRWIQAQFRAKELHGAREFFKTAIGGEEIVIRDKVIQLRNQKIDGFNWGNRAKEEHYIANGEIGGVGPGKNGFLNVAFAGKHNVTFGYRGRDFKEDSAPLELAYALTIHKAQGSQFGTVFVILPKASRLLSRELLYTALTRSRERLVLLIEGDDSGLLYDLSKPERSNVACRNTNLFSAVVRREPDSPPHAEHLIHKALKGHMVRSKIELIIADKLFNAGIFYEYEKPLDGSIRKGRIFPDFSFADAAGDRIIWEHFGRMDDPQYLKGHEWKMKWYAENGFSEGENLFLTKETLDSGIDSSELDRLIEQIQELI